MRGVWGNANLTPRFDRYDGRVRIVLPRHLTTGTMPWRFQGTHLFSTRSTFNRRPGRTVPHRMDYFAAGCGGADGCVAGDAAAAALPDVVGAAAAAVACGCAAGLIQQT